MRACPSWSRLCVLMLPLGCISCSSERLHPVHGTVLYKNAPMEGVIVTFHPQRADANTVLPVGTTKEDGTFTLMTGDSEGAPAGEYVVTAICLQQGEEKRTKTTRPRRFTPEDRFKGAFAKEATSKIKIEIKNGKNELEPFNLQ
jgi:hypothetical protein